MAEVPGLPTLTVRPKDPADYIFEEGRAYDIQIPDFTGARLSGHLGLTAKPLNVNFESCLLRGLTFAGLTLHACDFLDTNMSESTFS